VLPKPTCIPCGGPADFNCTTVTHVNLGGGTFRDGPGGQLWRIQTPDGNVTNLYSTNPTSARSLGYEFISPHLHEYTGLRVLDTDSTWNGTTFQCIAYTPSNTKRQNDSAAAVTLKVGGEYRHCALHKFTCWGIFVPSVITWNTIKFLIKFIQNNLILAVQIDSMT